MHVIGLSWGVHLSAWGSTSAFMQQDEVSGTDPGALYKIISYRFWYHTAKKSGECGCESRYVCLDRFQICIEKDNWEKGLCFWFQFVAKMGPPCSIPHPRVFKFCLNWKSRGDQFGTKRTDDAFVFPGTIFAYSAASTAPLLLSPPHRPPLPFRLQCVISQIFCAKLWQTWSWAVRMVLFFSAVGGCSCINLKRTISNDKQTKQMHPQASEIQI